MWQGTLLGTHMLLVVPAKGWQDRLGAELHRAASRYAFIILTEQI